MKQWRPSVVHTIICIFAYSSAVKSRVKHVYGNGGGQTHFLHLVSNEETSVRRKCTHCPSLVACRRSTLTGFRACKGSNLSSHVISIMCGCFFFLVNRILKWTDRKLLMVHNCDSSFLWREIMTNSNSVDFSKNNS